MSEDFERYGDYNEIDEAPKSKNPVLIALKVITALVCISVIGILAVRLILFSSYPKSVSNMYFNEELIAYYDENQGDIDLKTQKLRAPYSDSKNGYFFCDYLILAEEIGQLQITVRYNDASIEYIANELKIELDANDEDIFSYRLCDNKGNVYYPSDSIRASRAMYEYEKLVFDGVDYSTEKGAQVNWIRLEVFVKGQKKDSPYAMVAIFENNDNYSSFVNYKLSKKEIPS